MLMNDFFSVVLFYGTSCLLPLRRPSLANSQSSERIVLFIRYRVNQPKIHVPTSVLSKSTASIHTTLSRQEYATYLSYGYHLRKVCFVPGSGFPQVRRRARY
jgi:hypothetical protein